MAIFRLEVTVCQCEKCGTRWIPRNALKNDELPTRCGNPKCNSPWWNDTGHKRNRKPVIAS